MERLTQPEEDALRALWHTGPGFVKEVLEQLPAPRPPYTTLASTLRNLERKLYVSAEKLGNSFRYAALVSAEDYQRRSLGALVREHFRDSYKELVSFFAKEEKVSAADLQEIIRLIEKPKPGVVMAPILLYLLKANAVLVLFAAAYYGLLRRLTFFGLNRAYLLLALLFAAVYPALPVPALLSAGSLAALPAPLLAGASTVLARPDVASAPGFDWLALVLGVYAFGTALLLLRLLAQLLSLASVRRRARPAVVLGQPVRVLAEAGGPFSFGQSIYLSEATLADPTNLPAALRHEQAHVRQQHTLDVLLTQLALSLAWANPAAWLLRRAVLDNLEYLADREVLQTGLDRRAYQYSLLRQQPGWVPAPALAFHFSFLTLKNRIAMLNQPASTARQLGRYLLAAPLLMALALSYSAAHAQVVPTPAPAEKPVPKNVVYYVDGQKADQNALAKINPDDIGSIDIIKMPQQQQIFGTTNVDGTAVITTKANANTPAVLALDKRISAVLPLVPATPEQNAGMEAAKAYIAKNYPNAKLQSVGPAKGRNDRYETIFVEGGKRLQLLFDGNGQSVQQ